MRRELLTFLCIGAAATFAHIAIAIALEAWLDFSAQNANFGGYLSAVGLSYVGHATLTFRVHANHSRNLPKFVVVSLVGLSISTTLVAKLAVQYGLNFAYVMLIVGGVVASTTFLLSKFWAFTETELGQSS
jgi:putative flippase GtrA